MSISVVLPAYHESENLTELLPKINKTMTRLQQPYEVLVIDTMTKTDNTDEICSKNNCTYINREGGNNYGDAIRTGIQKAVMEYLVIMDADGSHNPDDIVKFYAEIKKGNDLIIGSRYIAGGNSHNGFILKLMSYALNLTYRLFFKIKAKDISNSFRMYTSKQITLLTLECDNFDIVEEIIIKLSMTIPEFKIVEIPVFFDRRKYGESKRDLMKFILTYIATIKRLMRVKRLYNNGEKDEQ
jgi:dolichol-phosphate mannosyltransferase